MADCRHDITVFKMRHYCFTISDYEHSGDLEWGKQEILSNFPNIKNLYAFEEIDREAEADYEEEYGECDEHIYEGYVEFDAPDEYAEALSRFSL